MVDVDKQDIHNVGKMLGLLPWQSEKDYIQHLFLKELYQLIATDLVFKGGTALQKVYGLPRFSRDLDFNAVKTAEFGVIITKIAKIFRTYGFLVDIKKEKHKFAENYLILFDSPEFKNSLSVQISLREKTLTKPHTEIVTPMYREIPPYSVYVMTLDEILAEKVRAILTRGFPRDVYDLWFLLKKGVKPNYELINQKISFSKDEFKRKIEDIRREWSSELSKLIQHYPPFDEVKQLIVSML